MPETTEIPVALRLSSRAQATLLRQAHDTGKDLSQLASDWIEHFVTRPSIDDIMAPVHQQAAASGMSDQEIDDFLRSQLEAHRREKKVRVTPPPNSPPSQNDAPTKADIVYPIGSSNSRTAPATTQNHAILSTRPHEHHPQTRP